MVRENESNAEVKTRRADSLPHSAISTPHSSGDLPEILIVEDSPVVRELLRRTLTKAGYAVSVAQDGEEGLQAARAHRPALVMSDINMPVMNGYQLCRAIKFDDDLWNIPLILCTVLAETEDIIEAINSGADAYIVKPFVEANLLERIHSLLDAPIVRRLTEERRMEIVSYNGKRHAIAGGGQQILNLLFSLYENTLNQNQELTIIQAQLNLLNEDLDAQVGERTAALGLSEARFRNIVETTSDLIWEIDENGVYTYASPRIHDLLGYLPEEIIGKTPFDLMPAEEAQRMANLFTAGISAREAFVNLENINLHQNGHRVILETSAVPVIDQEGRFRGYHGIDRDITERKKSEEFIKNILECVDEGFIIIDRDFRILSANKAYSKIVEIPIDKIIGRYCHEVFYQSPVPCAESKRECAVKKVFATGKSHTTICQREDAKGGVTYLEIKAYPHSQDGNGRVITAIETLVDITEKYKLEDQLRQAQKMEDIGTLAGGIAHDFNNMLSPILGYSVMAVKKLSPDDPLAEDLQQVITAAERAKGLVQQILTFSRRSPLEKIPVQPQLVVKEALKLLRASLPTTIEIRQDIPAECGTILADPTQFHQIIMNLGTNAYHAMRETGGVLEVRLTKVTIKADSGIPSSELAPGEYLLLAVSDTGCGMDKQTMARIFEPYFTTKAKGEGTGLGLAVIHGVVKSYKGHITVDSEPGKGTCFHIYLPRITETPAPAETIECEDLPMGTERLLVVDDDEVLAAMLQRMLQPLGYQVRFSCNSLEALALIEQAPMAVDLLITDMTMPHQTGLELTTRVLAIRPELPIILCTGFSDLVNKEQALALGIRAYLTKPVSIRNLALAVRKALDTKREFS